MSGTTHHGWRTHVPHARHYRPWLAYTRSACQALQAMAGVHTFRMPGAAGHGWHTHVPHARHYGPWLAYTRSACQALQAMAGVLKFRMPGTACHGRRTHVPHARHYTPCNSLVNIFRGTTLHVNSFSNNMHVRNKSRCHKKTNKHYTYNYNTF